MFVLPQGHDFSVMNLSSRLLQVITVLQQKDDSDISYQCTSYIIQIMSCFSYIGTTLCVHLSAQKTEKLCIRNRCDLVGICSIMNAGSDHM